MSIERPYKNFIQRWNNMSRGERETKDSIEFIDRLTEACGSAKVVDIQRILGISYQTAKNYLNGRLPHAEILIKISQRTNYSIDWLLTGQGNKLARAYVPTEMPTTAGELKRFVKAVVEEVVSDEQNKRLKTYVLKTEEMMSEKVLTEVSTFSE